MLEIPVARAMQLALSMCLGPSLLPQALAAECVLDASSSPRPVVPPKVKRFLAPRSENSEDRPDDHPSFRPSSSPR